MRGALGPKWLIAFDFGFSKTSVELEGVPFPYDFRQYALGGALVREFPLGRVVPFTGVRMAFVLMTRSFEDPGLLDQHFSSFTPGLVAGARLRLGDGFHLGVRGRLNYLHYNIDEDQSLGLWDLSASVGYGR